MKNILSVADMKFLRNLHYRFGINYLIFDERGVRTDKGNLLADDDNLVTDYYCILSEISKKIRLKLNGYFRLDFSESLDFDVEKI